MDIGESSEPIIGSTSDSAATRSNSATAFLCDEDENTSIDYNNMEKTKLLLKNATGNHKNQLSIYNSITSSDCKVDDDGSCDCDDDSISITVLDYASSLKDFVQPAIERSSCLMKYLKSRHPQRSSTSSISPSTSSSSASQPSTPKQNNHNPLQEHRRVRFLGPLRSKHSSPNRPPLTTVSFIRVIIGLLVLLVASSSWWIMHSKHSRVQPSSQQPNPYYFWKLVYKNDDSNGSSQPKVALYNSFFSLFRPSTESISLSGGKGKNAASSSSTSTANTSYKPPTITSNKLSKSPSSKLVIAGKMTVEDEFCNIAELTLNDGEWNLKERIQLSLYNSYSGGEVYSLLVNHTFNRDSFSFFDNKGHNTFVNGGSGSINEEKSSKSHDQSVSAR